MKRCRPFSRIEHVLNRIRSASSRVGGLGVAERLEHPLHPLGVVLVHLTAERGHVVALHRVVQGYRCTERTGARGRSARREPGQDELDRGPRGPSGASPARDLPAVGLGDRAARSPARGRRRRRARRAPGRPGESARTRARARSAGCPGRRRSPRSEAGRRRHARPRVRTSPSCPRGVLDRVAREIPDRLRETVGIGVERSLGDGTELEAAVGGQADAVPQLLDERRQLDRLAAAGSWSARTAPARSRSSTSLLMRVISACTSRSTRRTSASGGCSWAASTSSWPRITVSGVRSSCEASATNSR